LAEQFDPHVVRETVAGQRAVEPPDHLLAGEALQLHRYRQAERGAGQQRRLVELIGQCGGSLPDLGTGLPRPVLGERAAQAQQQLAAHNGIGLSRSVQHRQRGAKTACGFLVGVGLRGNLASLAGAGQGTGRTAHARRFGVVVGQLRPQAGGRLRGRIGVQ